MPEKPFASTLARSAISARTIGDRQRLADAGGVAAKQIELQRGELIGRDRDFGQRAESGVDAVDRGVAARRVAVDDRARGVDARSRAVRCRPTVRARPRAMRFQRVQCERRARRAAIMRE